MRLNTVQEVRQYTIYYAVKASETERNTGSETVKQTGTTNAGIETTYDPEIARAQVRQWEETDCETGQNSCSKTGNNQGSDTERNPEVGQFTILIMKQDNTNFFKDLI